MGTRSNSSKRTLRIVFREAECSERDIGSHANDGFIAHALGRVIRIRNAAGRMEDVLEIGLQLPPRRDLILVRCLENGLSAAHRKPRRGESASVAVESSRMRANLRVTDRHPDHVIVAALQWGL